MPGFVEDVVGRQQRLVLLKQDLPLADQHRGVAQRLAGVPARGQGRAHQHRGPGITPGNLRQPGQGLLHLLDQGGLLHQVPGRVAHQKQLREDDEVRGAAMALQGVDDLLQIAADIPHRGVELGQGDFHDACRRLSVIIGMIMGI